MIEKTKEIKRLEEIFSDWKEVVPVETWQLFEETVEKSNPIEIYDFLKKYESIGKDWGFAPYSPFVSKMLRLILAQVMTVKSQGMEHVEAAFSGLKSGKADRVVILANHQSYADANMIDTVICPVLKKYGFSSDMSVVVGPKVFSLNYKKLSAMHFNTLQIAQSLAVATKDAALPPREIARAAKQVVDDIKQYVKILLIFPEGGRSRTGELLQFLSGVLRLIDTADRILLLPIGMDGGNRLLPISERKINFAKTSFNVGKPIYLSEIKKLYEDSPQIKQDIMDHLGREIAKLLPEGLEGYYKHNL